MEKFGVSTQLLAGGDIYPALELGTIDATEFSMPVMDEGLGFYRVAKHYYFPGWHQPPSLNDLLLTRAKYEALSKLQKDWLRVTCLPMSSIDWHGGEIRLEESTVPLLFNGVGAAAGADATMVITGGTLHLALLNGQQEGTTENLPFTFGANRPINYEITANSFLTFELTLPDGVVTGTFTPNNLNVTQNDPFNGVMINPPGFEGEDIAFFIHDWIMSTNGGFSCVPSDGCDAVLTHLGLNIAGWGTGQVPEPAAMALLGLGLLGVGVARRRRA